MNIIVALLILGIIIIIHELGHFLLAKKNGITVTEFSVGMGPRIASFVKNGTRYSLKAFPIGGSCMMLGEDETIDDEGAFNKKGVWARFSVIFAGAFFNFILAFILALIVLSVDGVDLPKVSEVKKNSAIEQAGIREGDWITSINGNTIHFDREIMTYFYFNPVSEEKLEISYLRDGKEETVTVTPQLMDTYYLGCSYDSKPEPAELKAIAPDYPLANAGLVVGDVITAINGTTIETGEKLREYFDEYPLTEQKVEITYIRNGQEPRTEIIKPKFEKNSYELGWNIDMTPEKVSALNAVRYSFHELQYNIVNTVKSLGYLISGRINMREVSGPVGIVNIVGEVVSESKEIGIGATMLSLARFCIFLSANLGVMNLLPIPALDGGRLVFILIEAIRRKPVPKEKEAIVHLVGMALLMILMVFVLFNDIRNIFG